MTTQRVVLNDDQTGLQVLNGDGATASTVARLSILDAVDIPIVVVRRDLVVAGFNRAAKDVLDLSPSDIGLACRDISVLAASRYLEEQCERVIAGGFDARLDFRDQDKWFVVHISRYVRGDREVAGAVMTFTNVTAFRASIDQAVYEREFTKAILNTIADPLVVLSADLRIQSGNRAFYTMFGVSRDETQELPLYDLGNGLASLRTKLGEMLADNQVIRPLEVDHVIPAAGQRTLSLDARPLSLPGHRARRYLVTFEDITARKQAEAANDLRVITERKRSEEELRRSETFLAEGQRLSLTGSFSWRVATDEISWSEQLYRIFEIDQSVPVTLKLIETRIHPEDISLHNAIIDCVRSSRADFDYEYRLLMADHSVKYLHVIAHGTRDRDGRLEYIGAVQDVTQRRLSEDALAKTRADLAHATRVTGLGVLTASIAHEVNQPLAAIVTNGESSLRWLARDEPDLERVRTLTKRVVADAQRASEIIERVRDMASPRAPAQKLLSINDVINGALSFLRPELQQKGILVSLDLGRELPQIIGDRTQLQQVVVNLTVNAVQAMSQLVPADRRISVRTMPWDPQMVRCSIEDSGPGIDPKHLPLLFDSFFTTKDTGMGMGLAICRSIVEAYGGYVGADNDSALGGARFSFDLPTCRAE